MMKIFAYEIAKAQREAYEEEIKKLEKKKVINFIYNYNINLGQNF